MATKEEIIVGLEMTISEAKRTTSLFAEGEWDSKRAAGWTPKEIYSHLASVAAIIPNWSQSIMSLPEGADLAQGMDVDRLTQMNAQSVAAMASMTPEQVMKTLEANYRKLIDYVKSAPDEQLNAKRRFFSEVVPVSDILASSTVLHGLHHVYEAYSRLGAPA
ncbi:MAG: ClbS/DfsB family four-helix bundle protein [Chloroflexi bacterium]|nr:ClbS/DfsB family four-helix bundle protein [Chloroflexota bacterium]